MRHRAGFVLRGAYAIAVVITIAWWVASFWRVELVGYSDPLWRAVEMVASRGKLLLILARETGFNGPQLPQARWEVESYDIDSSVDIADGFVGCDDRPLVILTPPPRTRRPSSWRIVTEHAIANGSGEIRKRELVGGFRIIDGLMTYPDGQAILCKRAVEVPAWAVAALLMIAVLPSARWVRRWCKKVRRRSRGQCVRCGYDLRASRERCPECGTLIHSEVSG